LEDLYTGKYLFYYFTCLFQITQLKTSIMKTILYSLLMGLFVLAACNSKKSESSTSTDAAGGTSTTTTETKAEDGQATPDGAANMIFAAASSGDYSKLKGMCDPALETDKDSKMICEVPDDLKNMFKEHFSKGKVVGAPTIEGDDAKVNITFGPDGSKEETFNFKKKDGKWYIVSF
jgi:hypothetical protein